MDKYSIDFHYPSCVIGDREYQPRKESVQEGTNTTGLLYIKYIDH